jgi:hypothetical protein
MYKVWCLASGERTYATNGLEFETVAEAETYGRDLYSRWMGLEKWAVLPVSDEHKGFLSIEYVNANQVVETL